jgi:hypothetical protein
LLEEHLNLGVSILRRFKSSNYSRFFFLSFKEIEIEIFGGF